MIERRRHRRQRGHRFALGQPGGFQPGLYGMPGAPDMAFGIPGPGSPGIPPGATPPTQPAGLFPTSVKVGDVVNVTGPFQGAFQGQVLVRFAGAPAMAVALLGPFGGSVVVPEGAQSGACTIERDGRTIFGGSCVVSQGGSGGAPPARAPEHAGARAWHNVGEGTALLGDDMTYHHDRYQGVGAIAAAAPAPRSAPAPTFYAPELRAPVVRGRTRVYPGVTVARTRSTRPPMLVSGVRRGRPPLAGLGAIALRDEASGGAAPSTTTGVRNPIRRIGAAALATNLSRLAPAVRGVVMPVPPPTRTPTRTTIPRPQIGTGIGQPTVGVVVPAAPAPMMTAPPAPTPTAIRTAGAGVVATVRPAAAEMIDDTPTLPEPGPSQPITATAPRGASLLLLGGGALAALFLLRGSRRSRR